MKSIEHYEQLAREASGGDRHERRQCDKCGSLDIFDRELSLDANWQITTPPAVVRLVVSVICYTCNHNLALGPSNDTYPVEVEIRAAEIAAYLVDTQVPPMSNAELRGYEAHANDTDGPPFFETDCGWLAREIIMHGVEESA